MMLGFQLLNQLNSIKDITKKAYRKNYFLPLMTVHLAHSLNRLLIPIQSDDGGSKWLASASSSLLSTILALFTALLDATLCRLPHVASVTLESLCFSDYFAHSNAGLLQFHFRRLCTKEFVAIIETAQTGQI